MTKPVIIPAPAVRLLLMTGAVLAPAASYSDASDHHMHIYTEDGTRVWAAMCEAIPGECNDGEPIPEEALPGEAAIRALDAAGLDNGAVLSLAYWYGSPRVAGSEFDDQRYVRAENEFIAREVSRFPDRLTGFFSVNPLKDYAVDEIRYWAERSDLSGLKLHLANAAFDFADPEHMNRLAAVIDVMNDHALPVIIHLRHGSSGYGYEQATRFIEQVAGNAPDVIFQLAHMAGWGGYDDGTDGAVQAFLDAIANGTLSREKIWFDLAAVVDEELTDDALANLRSRVREIGFERLLFATDWDSVEPAEYSTMLKNYLQLSDAEMNLLMSNVAPYLR